jgi:hypothetical protein
MVGNSELVGNKEGVGFALCVTPGVPVPPPCMGVGVRGEEGEKEGEVDAL